MSWLIFHHQSHYLAKFCFFSYGPKCCQPIKLQDSWKCNISRKKGMMKFIFVIQINIKVFYQLMLPFLVCIARLVQSTQNKKFAYLCNISRKIGDEVVLLPADKYESTQSTQNNKFAISLQYLEKNGKSKVDFVLADKYQRFLPMDSIILGVCSQTSPNYPK